MHSRSETPVPTLVVLCSMEFGWYYWSEQSAPSITDIRLDSRFYSNDLEITTGADTLILSCSTSSDTWNDSDIQTIGESSEATFTGENVSVIGFYSLSKSCLGGLFGEIESGMAAGDEFVMMDETHDVYSSWDFTNVWSMTSKGPVILNSPSGSGVSGVVSIDLMGELPE